MATVSQIRPYEIPGWCEWEPAPRGGIAEPSTERIALGTDPDGKTVDLLVNGRSTLVYGTDVSARRAMLDNIITEVMGIPADERLIAYVDTSGSVGSPRWSTGMDAVATTLDEAYELLANLRDEAERRIGFARSDSETYEEFLDSGLFPTDKHGLIFLVVEDISEIMVARPGEECEEARQKVWEEYRLLTLDVFYNKVGISLIAGSPILLDDEWEMLRYQNRLCGVCPSCDESYKMLGEESYLRDGIDASKLRNGWFYLAEYQSLKAFPKVRLVRQQAAGRQDRSLPMAADGRGDWMLAPHGTTESKRWEWRTDSEKYGGCRKMGFPEDTTFEPICV